MAQYSRQQAEEILRRAMARDEADGVSHEDLLAAAAEVGIDPVAVEQAANDLAQEHERGATEAAIVREHRRGFGRQLVTLGFLNVVALAVDVMTGPGAWYHWVALGSAVLLGFRAIRTFMPAERDIRRARRRVEKRHRRERRARELARVRAAGARERARPGEAFERVVEEGVEALFHAAADRLADYNRGQRPSSGPRVRVDPTPEGDSDPSSSPVGEPRGGSRHRHRG